MPYHRNLELHPISGGEYEVVRWNRGQDVILSAAKVTSCTMANKSAPKPYFAQMRFRIIEDANTRLLALKSGDIEEGELETEQWQTQTTGEDYYRDNTKVAGPEWLYMYIGWNMDTKKVPFFGDHAGPPGNGLCFQRKANAEQPVLRALHAMHRHIPSRRVDVSQRMAST